MATFAFTDASVTINGVDLSNDVKSVTLEVSAEDLDDSAMGDTYHSRLAGLKDWNVSVEFNQDYAAGQVDATLFPLIGAAAFAIAIRPTSAAVGATNPNYNGSVILTGYTPAGGEVGSLASASASFAGASTLTRSTS